MSWQKGCKSWQCQDCVSNKMSYSHNSNCLLSKSLIVMLILTTFLRKTLHLTNRYFYSNEIFVELVKMMYFSLFESSTENKDISTMHYGASGNVFGNSTNLDSTTKSFRYFIGSLNISIATIGAIGNFITMICLIYALKKKKFGIEKHFVQNFLSINLCFIDWLFCVFYILPESPSYFLNYWPISIKYCQIIFLVTGMLGMTRRHILVVITILHCIELTRSNLWIKWKQSRTFLVVFLTISWSMGVFGGFADIGFQSINAIGWNDDLGLLAGITISIKIHYYYSICTILPKVKIFY